MKNHNVMSLKLSSSSSCPVLLKLTRESFFEIQIGEDEVQEVLCKALEEISTEKQYQEKCLLMLVHALQSFKDHGSEGSHNSDAERFHLFYKYQLLVSSVLMASLLRHFPGMSIP